MTQSNVDQIRALYSAFAAGDIPAVLSRMSPDVVWNEAENILYADGNPYRGPEAVVSGVFARIGEDWEGFQVVPEELLDCGGDTVIALGRYRGTHKQTGNALDAQMVHVWRLDHGKVTAFQQYADTLQFARAAGTL